MQDVTECTNEIGRSNSVIFSTLDLTSGLWQMLLHPKSRKFTAFTLPGLGQFDALFSRLAVHNLKVKLQKCVFGSRQVQYLGFLLSEDGIRPGTDKLKAVSHAQPPSTVKEVRQFLG
jgi:hypothetical protein